MAKDKKLKKKLDKDNKKIKKAGKDGLVAKNPKSKGDKNLDKAKKLKAGKAKKGFPAKKAGKAAVKKARPGVFTWKAPSDFKPHDLIVAFRTNKDGLIAGDFEAVRYQGRFAEEVDEKKKSVMSAYDPKTLLGMASRMAGLSYNTNGIKYFPEDIEERNSTEKFKNANGEKKERLVFRGKHRMPKNTTFRCLFRIGKKSADGTITVSLKRMWQQGTTKKGRVTYVELEKTDPVMKLFKGAKRGGIIAAAFQNVLMPPKKTRSRKVRDEESDDE